MSSVGQFAGAVVGAVAGFLIGGPSGAIYGAQIGMTAGGLIDPPPGPHTEGPRLSDLAVQTSTYGAGKTRAYGTVAVTGNVFWMEGDAYKEHVHTQESGGKGGGGGASYTTYTYSATFAVALTELQEVTGIRRLWVGDRLIYDAGSDNVESIIASNSGQTDWKLYTGSDTQEAEPRMQADKGAANVSAYPGRAYIVFYDLDLTKHYSNTLLSAQVKAEIVVSGNSSLQNNLIYTKFVGDTGTYGTRYPLVSHSISQLTTEYVVFQQYNWDYSPQYLYWGLIEYPDHDESSSYSVASVPGGWGYDRITYATCQTDNRLLLTMQRASAVEFAPWFRLFGPSGIIEHSGQYINQSGLVWSNTGGYVVFDQGDIFISNTNATGSLQKLDIFAGWVGKTDDYAYPGWIGASENYLFMATNINTTQVIRKFDRLTFAEVAAWTIPGSTFQVVDDDTLYVAKIESGGATTIKKWESGVNTGTWTTSVTIGDGGTDNGGAQFRVFSDNPFYCIGTRWTSGGYVWQIINENLPTSGAYIRNIVSSECGMVGLSSSDLDLNSLNNDLVPGYLLSGVKTPRAALEPLQAAWPFDVYQKGYKVGFRSRGGASVATIAEADLGAVAGNEHALLLPVSREMETQIARTVTVKYFDASRDYEIGEQTAPERPGVSSVEPRQVELPIVFTADEAAQVADVLNAKAWTERVKFGPFSLPPTYANLEPSDVVTINHRNRSWEARLTRIEYLPDGRLNCAAVLTASAAYDSSASGSDPIVVGQSLVTLAGSSRFMLLDIPRIDSAQDVPGLAAVMWGIQQSWPGGILVRSDDQGNTWQSVAGFSSKANIFTATNSIGAALTGMLDYSSVLTVTPDNSTSDLYSITEAQLFAGSNLAAYGADGRWEIVSFKTVALSSGTYTLTNFLRGRYGTEWAMTQHAAGDKLVMLDSSTRFAGLPTNAINSARLWRGVTQGMPISTATDQSYTYAGINLKPLAPIYLNGNRHPATLDWTITATRRSRSPVEPFSGVATPLGESSELYDIEVWDSSYSTLKRTFSSLSSLSATYTAAQQIADFSVEQSTLYIKAYQLSATVGRGYPLQSSIYRYLPLDPYGDFVTLLLHMDDTGLTDVKGNAVTLFGNITREADAAAFGGYWAALDGTGDYLRIPYSTALDIGSGDFTVEVRAKVTAYSSAFCQLCGTYTYGAMDGGTNNAGWAFGITSTGLLQFGYGTGGGFTAVATSTNAVGTGSIKYLTAKKVGTNFYLGINGVTDGTGTISSPFTTTKSYFYVGTRNGTDVNVSFNGKLEEVRVTKGVGRDVSVVPTAAFPNP